MSDLYRIGIDIGGTFTDAVVMDEQSGDFHPVKVSSTPDDPSHAFMEAYTRGLTNRGLTSDQIRFVVHGTTVATNTIIQQKGARIGLIASEGFSDLFEIAWQIRPNLYDLNYDKPPPLVPRHLCIGVPERIDARGAVLVPLNEPAVDRAARQLAKDGVEAILVCFLHAYRDPAHERRAAEIVKDACPDLPVCVSSDICPEYREYTRASTTAVNAALLPAVGAYVERLEDRLGKVNPGSGLFLMTSGGGIIASGTARQQPVQLIESGPAAGVIAATYIGQLAGFENLIALDIGGTTAKAALIENGRPRLAAEFEVGDAAVATTTRDKGQGYPVKTPVIDLVEIGSGGGSIGHVDPGGALAVGPQSAGAAPGPACYGKGGSEPTLTDANLVLGRLNPDYFLGGELRLDVSLAKQAIERRIATPLNLPVEDAAAGLIEIANANMTGILQLVSVQKGVDPRAFVLVAFGGAGPVHAVALAKSLHIGTVLVPPSPGVTTALGLLVTDLRHDYVRTYISATDELNVSGLSDIYSEFEAHATRLLLSEGVSRSNIRFIREADMRYTGQSYELRVPVGRLSDDLTRELNDAFFTAHRRQYGFATRDEPTEFVNVRLSAVGAVPRPSRRQVSAGGPSAQAAMMAVRDVSMPGHDGPASTAIYDRYRLEANNRFPGPAIVEEIDSTTLVPPGCTVNVDDYGNLVIDVGRAES